MAQRAPFSLRSFFRMPAIGGKRPARGPTLNAKRRVGAFIEQRASQAGKLIFFATGGQVRRTEVKFEDLAREGYQSNPVVYRCFRLIAQAIASMPVQVFDKDKDVTLEHPLAMVLRAPNPDQVWGELVEAMCAHLGLAGEFFLEGVTLGGANRGQLAELYALRPDKMEIQPGADGGVSSYIYNSGSGQQTYPVPPASKAGSGQEKFRPILHLKYFNPLDHYRGLPPLLPGASAGDEHNQSVAYAKSLYTNSARPSGALVYNPKDGPASLTDEQFARLNDELTEQHTGAENAGKPLLLDGGLKWEQMGLSPADMQSSEGRNAAAREIALAMGVPPLMLGIKGDNTFANYQEARLAFWEETCWPLAQLLAQKLTRWIAPLYGPEVRVAFDPNGSPIGEAAKATRWDRVSKADFIKTDEKRAELGFEPLENGQGEHVLVPAAMATLEDVIAGDDGGDPNAYGSTNPPKPSS